MMERMVVERMMGVVERMMAVERTMVVDIPTMTFIDFQSGNWHI